MWLRSKRYDTRTVEFPLSELEGFSMPEPQERDTITGGGSLSPERFARVRLIFEAALDRPAAERRGYVDGACGADDDLGNEVRRMLAAEGRPIPYSTEGPRPALRMKADFRPVQCWQGAIGFSACSAKAAWARYTEPSTLS